MSASFTTKEEFSAEHQRLWGWRERWARLANDRERMLRMGGLQRQMEYVQYRAKVANRKIATLFREYDLWRKGGNQISPS